MNSSSGSADLEVILETTDTYTLLIEGRSNSSQSIDYQVKAITSPVLNQGQVSLASTSTTPHQPIAGTLSEKGEWHTYTFTGQKGQVLELDNLQADDSDLRIQLRSPSQRYWQGSNFADVSSGNQQLSDFIVLKDQSIVLQEDGEYQVTLRGYQGHTGNYNFQLVDVDAAADFATGQDISGTVDPYASQFYAITGSAGERIYFDSDATVNNLDWRLYDSQLQSQQGVRNNLGEFEVVLSEDGIYYLELDNRATTPSAFTMRRVVTDAEPTPIALSFGIEQVGNIDVLGEQDAYTFVGQPGQQILIDPLDGDSNITFSLTSPSGKLLESGAMSSRSELITLTEPGDYQIIMDGAGDAVGSYNFQVQAPTAIAVETAQAGNLSNGEMALYRFEGRDGQKLLLDSLGGSSDVTLRLYREDGGQIYSGTADIDSTELSLSGQTYYVEVTGNGDYNFQLSPPSFTQDTSREPATPLALETLTNLNLAAGTSQIYKIAGQEGQSLWFDLLGSGSGTPGFKLYQPDGAEIWRDTYAYPYGTYYDRVLLNQTGDYYLEVTAPSNSAINRDLQVLSDSGLVAQTGDLVETIALDGYESKVYKLSGQAGQKLWLNGASASNASANISFYKPNREHPWKTLNHATGDLGQPIVLDQDGDYYLVVESNSSAAQTGIEFQLLSDTDATSIDLSNDPILAENFGNNRRDAHLYTFTGSEGQRIYFDHLSGSYTHKLFDASGQAVGSSSFAELEDGLPADGDYLLSRSG